MDLPNHVAIIPDGNRRWADIKKLTHFEGHRAGARTMLRVVDYFAVRQLKHLTVWGFSTDNWKRSRAEVSAIFHLLKEWIENDAPWVNSRGVRLRHIGRINELPDFLQLAINKAVELTKNNGGMTLNVAFNYTGRAEILDAVQRLIDSGRLFEPAMSRPQLDEELFSRYLYDNLPDVDLVIRTAGEFRLSNFMLWQTAYSELYFSELFWPDFSTEELEKALQAYSERKRRFGGD